ncbi:hypothetical protein EDF56_102182 [Novosphingobium sp. PhB165]|uniref:hypothetical protein n=1 Tax=Novosphingobium sp. PhB165 TaxID=2485105 RepID=UPI00104576F7|nr:hypothetical protein [Novosphingobium sp. PhB165]TCM20521.1 hypothetical protein EDF56_102182 [Novosphingobium sp. PhB165]
MNRPDLKVSVTQVSPSAIQGHIPDDDASNPWMRAGADVTIFLDPPDTAFDNGILGGGRIYEDRIEIDLTLGPDRTAGLVDALDRADAAVLHFQTRAISEFLFRVEAVSPG